MRSYVGCVRGRPPVLLLRCASVVALRHSWADITDPSVVTPFRHEESGAAVGMSVKTRAGRTSGVRLRRTSTPPAGCRRNQAGGLPDARSTAGWSPALDHEP